MRKSNQILLASTNRGKFEEFKDLFREYPGIELLPAEALIRNSDKIGHVEVHNDYLANAAAKARLANHACHFPCLADDSGLEVLGLEGRPGIKSRRFSIPKGNQSQDQANTEKLLQELTGKTGQDRSARFVATLALAMEGMLIHAHGVLEGKIAESPRGQDGFGYDPIFIPKGSDKTLAEMSAAEKNKISHRANALHQLMNEIKARGIIFAKP